MFTYIFMSMLASKYDYFGLAFQNLKKLSLLHIHMNYQQEAIAKMTQNLETLKEQAQSMRR